MAPNHKHFSPASRGSRATMVFLIPLILAALACSIQTGADQSLKETDVAISIQQTLIAQTAAALEAGFVAAPATPAVQTPESQPEATATPLPTPTEEATLPPIPTDTPTTVATPTSPMPDSIPILEWEMSFWVPLNSGCRVEDALCWMMDDSYKKHLGASSLTLITKTPMLIDPSWPNPYLTFRHKYDFERPASVDLKIGSTWKTVRNLTEKSSGERWVQEAIDLKDYTGQTMLVRFTALGVWGSGGIPGSDWIVNDVNLIPDYKPGP